MVSDHGSICHECWIEIDFVNDPSCAKCGMPFEYDMGKDIICLGCEEKKTSFSKARFLFKYNEISKKIIHKFKYYDQTYLAKILAKLSLKKIGCEFPNADLILPVPLHRYRLMSRFYNQSSLLAKSIAKQSGKEFNCSILEKIVHTVPQASLTKLQREDNVKNSFVVNEKNRKLLQGKNILLIDDVMTTGSTVNECARVLLKNGCNSVSVFTLAKVVK